MKKGNGEKRKRDAGDGIEEAARSLARFSQPGSRASRAGALRSNVTREEEKKQFFFQTVSSVVRQLLTEAKEILEKIPKRKFQGIPVPAIASMMRATNNRLPTVIEERMTRMLGDEANDERLLTKELRTFFSDVYHFANSIWSAYAGLGHIRGSETKGSENLIGTNLLINEFMPMVLSVSAEVENYTNSKKNPLTKGEVSAISRRIGALCLVVEQLLGWSQGFNSMIDFSGISSERIYADDELKSEFTVASLQPVFESLKEILSRLAAYV